MRFDLSPLAAVTILLALAIVYGNDYLVTLTDGRAAIVACDTDMDCQLRNPHITMDHYSKEIRQ